MTAVTVFSAGTLALTGAVLAVLIGVATWALYTGLAARRAAAEAYEGQTRLDALLASAPVLSMVVRADGRLDLSDRLTGWLGLATTPRYLADLDQGDTGLPEAEARALAARVAAAHKAAEPFAMPIHPRGAVRALMVRGARAVPALGAPGGVILWFFDATEAQRELDDLRHDSAALREAFEALTALIEAAPLPMWYRGPDMRLGLVNTAYVRAVEGADAGDVIARGLELLEETRVGGPLANAAAAQDDGAPAVRTLPATIGGARRTIRVHDVPLPIGGVAGYAIDIDDLEQARGDLKRFGDAQRAMLDRLSAGVAQFSADRALAFCNQPFQRMFAMQPEWLADRPEFDRVLERMREMNRVPEVRDFPSWKAERRDWFQATGEALEETWLLPGGVHLRVVAHPLPDGGLLLIFEDRTEQIQLASARDTLLRVRTATFENLFEALGVFAGDGRLQSWNNKLRQVWGFDEEFLATHPRVDALATAAAPRLANPARADLIGELVRSAAVGRQGRGGRVAFADGRHFEFAGVPLPDGNALFTMLDISDSRRIERALRDRNDALEAADRVKTAFVANMSYELRTPLTSIQGFAEMMGEGYAGKLTRTATGYVAAILESAARLSTLIDDVLDLTRADTGGVVIEAARVDLRVVARAAADSVTATAAQRGLDFAVEIAPSAGMVSGDAGKLRQMIEHLLRHAVLGSGEGGRVLLHLDGDARRARIIVSDDGVGMDAAAAARAFDRFAEPGPTRDGERALGLGLPLAKQFAEAHGGTIALLSEPGQGTLLTVELPRGA